MRFCFFLFTLLFSGSVAAQTDQPQQPWLLGVYANGSFIMEHTERMAHLAVSHPTGFEVNFQKQTNGSEAWHQYYKYPKVGFSFVYYDYRNPVMGQSFSVSTYLSKALYRSGRCELNYRLGLGLGYFTNRFDIDTNHKNTIVSSALNAMLQTRFEYDYHVSPAVSVLAAIGLNHYSNGSTSKPNLGINLPTISLGINYHRFPDWKPLENEPATLNKAVFYNVSTTIGFRRVRVGIPNRYLVNSLTAAVGKPLNKKSNALLGLEGFYDRGLKAEQEVDTTLIGKPFPDTKRAGIFIGHELVFGRLAFSTHLGLYIYRPYKVYTSYYERLGLKYHFTKTLFGAIDLKVHRGSADVIEWRLGAKF